MLGDRVKWEVFWVVTKGNKRYIVDKQFGNDLNSAILLWTKAKAAGKPFVTLRSKNVAFPPPAKYQQRVEIEKKRVKRNGRIRIVRNEIMVTPMTIVNHRGIVWCPYCREMRKFQKQEAFRFENILVPKPGYYCICGVSSENGMVRFYNPNAPRIVQRTRRSNGATRRGARKRTKRS